MSMADRDDAGHVDPESVAARLREAGFVRILARADGDGVAAAGVLAGALSERGVPFQVSAAGTVRERTERVRQAGVHATPDDETVIVGDANAGEGVRIDTVGDASAPASAAAWRVADAIATDPDPLLALAGGLAGGHAPGTDGTAPVLEAAQAHGLTRRPGVAVPGDVVDGLVHSTLVHAPFSGDPERVHEALARIDVDPEDPDEADHRAVASLVAIEAVGDETAAQRAGDAVEGFLRPAVPGGPFRTLGGYADVLDLVARTDTGTAVALALGHDVREAALASWRTGASRAHSAVRAANTARYDGLLAARVDAEVPVVTVARLLCDYRSPEPVALVVADGAAGAVSAPGGPDVRRAMEAAIREAEGDVDGTPGRAHAVVDEADPATLIAAFREALP